MTAWLVAILASIAQLRRDNRVTSTGAAELKRALIRGDLQTLKAFQESEGDNDISAVDDDDLPALATSPPEELLSALVAEASELEEAAASVGEDLTSSSSTAVSSSCSASEDRGIESAKREGEAVKKPAPRPLRMLRPSPEPVVLPDFVVALSALFLPSSSVAQLSRVDKSTREALAAPQLVEWLVGTRGLVGVSTLAQLNLAECLSSLQCSIGW